MLAFSVPFPLLLFSVNAIPVFLRCREISLGACLVWRDSCVPPSLKLRFVILLRKRDSCVPPLLKLWLLLSRLTSAYASFLSVVFWIRVCLDGRVFWHLRDVCRDWSCWFWSPFMLLWFVTVLHLDVDPWCYWVLPWWMVSSMFILISFGVVLDVQDCCPLVNCHCRWWFWYVHKSLAWV